MNRKQISFLSMTKRVLVHFSKNESAWEDIGVVKEVVDEMTSYVRLLDDPSQKQEQGTTGHTAVKDALFDTMIEKTFKLKLKISSYARHKKDTLMLQTIDYSKSALEAGSEADALVRCKLILQTAKANLDILAPYKVTKGEVDEVEKAIGTYEKAPAERDNVSSERKTATATIEKVLDDLRDNFETLDDSVYGMVEDDTFVSTYRNLRLLKEKGSRSPVEEELEVQS